MEVKVKQRSKEWYDIRNTVSLTSSKFGDALGIGMGKPYDFFMSLISDDPDEEDDEEVDSEHTKHGITMEEIIMESYQLLTGHKTRESGFWTPKDGLLADLIGASPDAVVVDENDPSKDIGLCEFKAPIYRMYKKENTVQGIPRHYMAQIQGQLAVTGLPWCNFMAVCKNTKEIVLKQVKFEPVYWNNVVSLLKQFCYALQDSQMRKQLGQDPVDFEGARKLQTWPIQRDYLPGELSIPVTDLLKIDHRGRYYGPSRVWLSFDFLVGETYSLPPNLLSYGESLIKEVDQHLLQRKKERSKEG